MSDVGRLLEGEIQRVPLRPYTFEDFLRRRDRANRNRRIGAFVVVAALIAGLLTLFLAGGLGTRNVPATPPKKSAAVARPLGAAIIGLDGKVRPISGLPKVSYSTTLSPDGRTIAFVTFLSRGSPQIATIGTDGSGYRILTHERFEAVLPAWSPDGKQIAYVAMNTNANEDIYVIDRDGSDRRRLTTSPRQDESPDWSPDGATIAYFSGPGATNLAYGEPKEQIWTVPARGGTPTRLTHEGISRIQPSWSPDGTLIAYGDDHGISVMNADGTGQHRVATVPRTSVFLPKWSPDGSKIAFLAFDSWGGFLPALGTPAWAPAPILRVHVLDLGTGATTPLNTTIAADAGGLSWLPSSDALLVYRWR